jgi:N-acetylneuraminate synthase
MDVVGFKIGSGECNNLPLIEHIARKGRPIILSTGMNDLASIRLTVNSIRKLGCPVMLTHCTSEYPAPYEHIHLGAIEELKNAFGVPVGLSDHSLGICASLGAIALGASLIEKHFTISREWPGPDCPMSIEPDELAELVKGAHAVWLAKGGSKAILTEEGPVIDFAYASVVSIRPVKAGEVLSLENVWVKRPGTGSIAAKDLYSVLGKIATHDLCSDVQISLEDFA